METYGRCDFEEVGENGTGDIYNNNDREDTDTGITNQNLESHHHHQCIICLGHVGQKNVKTESNLISSNIHCSKGEEAPIDIDQGYDLDKRTVNDDEDALLKLLKVEITATFPVCESNSRCVSYCYSCALRNKSICALFSQIGQLRRNLTSLKDEIEKDFKNSLKVNHFVGTNDFGGEILASANKGNYSSYNISNRKDFLRYHIAKSFNLLNDFPEPLDSNDNDVQTNLESAIDNENIDNTDDDDWEPNIVPKVAYSDSDSEDVELPVEQFIVARTKREFPQRTVQRIEKHNIPNKSWSRLKKLHGINKELRIFIKKLPSRILSQYSTSSEATTTTCSSNAIKSETAQKLEHTVFKCIFNDCPTSQIFSSSKERDNHVDIAHGHIFKISSSLAPSSSPAAAASRLRPRSKLNLKVDVEVENNNKCTEFKCVFEDCQSKQVFQSKQERHTHIKSVHGQAFETSSSSSSSSDEDDEDYKPSKSTSKSASQSRTLFKCIFADCTTLDTQFHKTKEEMHAHIKLIHGIDLNANDNDDDDDNNEDNTSNDFDGVNVIEGDNSIPPAQDPDPDSDDHLIPCLKKLPRSNFQCIFADCDNQEIFYTLKDRDNHVQSAHADALKPAESDEDKGKDPSENRKPKPKKKKRTINPNTACKPRLHCFVEGCKSRRYFADEAEREMHMKKIHEGVTHPFECSECGRKYRSNQERDVHVKSVHRGQFPHMCHFCGKGFTSLANLNAHIPKHTQERNFQCEQCLQTFKTQSGLVYHRRAIHGGEVERSHRCDRCGKGFFTFQKLSNHIKCVHNKTDKPVICEICGKRFAIRNYLYMHMRTHGKQSGNSSSAFHVQETYQIPSESKASTVSISTSTSISKKKFKLNSRNNNEVDVNSISVPTLEFPLPTTSIPQNEYLYENHSSIDVVPLGRNTLDREPLPPDASNIHFIHSSSFNPHINSNSNSNMSNASSCNLSANSTRPGSNPTVPVDLSHYHANQNQNNQLQVQFSSHRNLNIPRIFHGDISSHSHGVSNHSHVNLNVSSANSTLPNFMAMAMASGNTSGHGHQPIHPGPNSNVLSGQGHSSASMHHQYLQIMNTFDGLNSYKY